MARMELDFPLHYSFLSSFYNLVFLLAVLTLVHDFIQARNKIFLLHSQI